MKKVLPKNNLEFQLNDPNLENFAEHIKRLESSYPRKKASNKSQSVKLYDFSRQDQLSKAEVEVLRSIFISFANHLSRRLSSMLELKVSLEVMTVDQLRFDEFCCSIPMPSNIRTISLSPVLGNIVFEIDPVISYSLCNRLFGGEGETSPTHRGLSTLEFSAQKCLDIPVCDALRTALGKLLIADPSIEHHSQWISDAKIAHDFDMCILITFITKVADIEGILNLCIPYQTLKPAFPKLSRLANKNKKPHKEISISHNHNLEVVIDLGRKSVVEVKKLLINGKVPIGKSNKPLSLYGRIEALSKNPLFIPNKRNQWDDISLITEKHSNPWSQRKDPDREQALKKEKANSKKSQLFKIDTKKSKNKTNKTNLNSLVLKHYKKFKKILVDENHIWNENLKGPTIEQDPQVIRSILALLKKNLATKIANEFSLALKDTEIFNGRKISYTNAFVVNTSINYIIQKLVPQKSNGYNK